MSIYKLVWDDFCSWYLEIVKPGFEQRFNTHKLVRILQKVLDYYAPFYAVYY